MMEKRSLSAKPLNAGILKQNPAQTERRTGIRLVARNREGGGTFQKISPHTLHDKGKETSAVLSGYI